ncbi:MAG: LCP family protein, partial [Roseburia sp.]|nr:LCP family protein [Roseburia sp.]
MSEQMQDSQIEESVSSEKAEEKAAVKKRRGWNIPLLIIEVLVLLIAIGVLYIIITTTNEIERTDIDTEKIVINEEVVETRTEREEAPEFKGYRNIALFGVDARDGDLGKGTRSDTIIIASINQDTHEIKLVSVYRDTYLNLGNDKYNKCNGAYASGGPEQAI